MQRPVKRELTRKQKAIRRTVILIAMIFFASATGLYGFTPTQGRQYSEESYHTGATQLVQRFHEPSIKATKLALFDLTANEKVTMLNCVRWHPLVGWMDSSAAVIDCSSDAPLYGGTFYLSGSDPETLLLIFGRVKDQRVVSIKISLQKQSGQIEGRDIWTEYDTRTSVAQNWVEKDGARYFVESIDLKQEDSNSPMRIMIVAYDESGVELASVDASQYNCWASLG